MADGKITVEVSTQAVQAELERLRHENARLAREAHTWWTACAGATEELERLRDAIGRHPPSERQGTDAARWPNVAEFTLRMFRRTQIEIGVPRDKLMPEDFCAAVSWLVMQAPSETVLTKAKTSSGAPAGCYPEEWGPSTDRRLTCACGNPDPAHWMPAEATNGIVPATPESAG